MYVFDFAKIHPNIHAVCLPYKKIKKNVFLLSVTDKVNFFSNIHEYPNLEMICIIYLL